MPQNPIQFQKGMSLNRFIDQYGTEEKCHQALEKARWGQGYTCSKCGAKEHTIFTARVRKFGSASTINTKLQFGPAPFFMPVDCPCRNGLWRCIL